MEKRKYSLDERYQFVLTLLRNEETMADVARRHGISRTSLEHWRNQFLEGGRKALEQRPEQDSEKEKLKEENESLKAIVAELSVELRLLKKNGN